MTPSKRFVSTRLKTFFERFSYLKRTMRIVWNASKMWTLLWGILIGVRGVLPAASVYLTKTVVDSLAAAVGAGLDWGTVRPVLIPALLMGAVLLLTQIIQGLIGWVRAGQSELVQDYIKNMIHNQAAKIDLKFYEIPEDSNRMARANMEASTRSMSLLQNLGSLVQNVVTLIAVAALLIPYGAWLPIVLLLSTLPALWVVLHHNRLQHDWWEETTEDRRRVSYYDSVLTIPVMAPEVRVFELSEHFKALYQTLRKVLRVGRLRLLRNQTVAQFGAGVAALLVTAGSIAWMASRVLAGYATLGDIALFYQAFNQGQGLMRSLLSSIGQLFADAMFLEHLYTFLDTESEITGPADPVPSPKKLEDGVHFRDLTFMYPNSEHLALSNFNLFVPAGKTVALVGPNGAGKSTVTKMLCRFYDPTKGTVEIDGTDIRSFDVVEFRKSVAVMFQHPVKYIATLGENISIGDLKKEPSVENIAAAARGGGSADISNQLPDGYATLLGKQFAGGHELSGGQWQRVALSRAFFRDAPVVILDEPTSFMDSWAETAWLDRFRKLVKGRTALIVTHRFTTAMRADIIHVMDEGKVVESGSHDELIAKGGLYAVSWKAQTKTA